MCKKLIIIYPYVPATQKMITHLLKKIVTFNFKVGATKVMLLDLRRTELKSMDQIGLIDKIEIKQGAQFTAAPHPFGGCRMGMTPKTSVTDSSHRVHGIDNLFAADRSLPPTGPSVAPTRHRHGVQLYGCGTGDQRIGQAPDDADELKYGVVSRHFKSDEGATSCQPPSAMHEFTINFSTHSLLPAEYEYLIAALRRDIASERLKAEVRPEWSSYHLMNVRLSIRLLEAFGYQEDGFRRGDGPDVNRCAQKNIPH